jgi:hypothetical protein
MPKSCFDMRTTALLKSTQSQQSKQGQIVGEHLPRIALVSGSENLPGIRAEVNSRRIRSIASHSLRGKPPRMPSFAADPQPMPGLATILGGLMKPDVLYAGVAPQRVIDFPSGMERSAQCPTRSIRAGEQKQPFFVPTSNKIVSMW